MVQKHRMSLVVVLVCLIHLFIDRLPVLACSLWAVTGDKSKNSRTLIAQNWDVPQGAAGELRLVIPEKGFRYLGLFSLNQKAFSNPVAGINERGLAIVSASADTIMKSKKLKGRSDLLEIILTTLTSVDSVLENRNLIAKSRPVFLIVADHSKIALIQIGSGGRCTVEATGNGLLYQTNHYTSQNLLRENVRYIPNSPQRLNRLQNLLANHPDPFTIDDFLSIAGDRNNGPDNSIWRVGGFSKKERTLASWVALLPGNSPPEVYFKLLNPGSQELNYELKLDKPFWIEGTE